MSSPSPAPCSWTGRVSSAETSSSPAAAGSGSHDAAVVAGGADVAVVMLHRSLLLGWELLISRIKSLHFNLKFCFASSST